MPVSGVFILGKAIENAFSEIVSSRLLLVSSVQFAFCLQCWNTLVDPLKSTPTTCEEGYNYCTVDVGKGIVVTQMCNFERLSKCVGDSSDMWYTCNTDLCNTKQSTELYCASSGHINSSVTANLLCLLLACLVLSFIDVMDI